MNSNSSPTSAGFLSRLSFNTSVMLVESNISLLNTLRWLIWLRIRALETIRDDMKRGKEPDLKSLVRLKPPPRAAASKKPFRRNARLPLQAHQVNPTA